MHNKKWFQTESFKYTIYGSVFGLLFPIVGTLFDLTRLSKEITIQNIILIQTINPIHFIIDTAPLFLGLFALIGGKKQDKLIIQNQEIVRMSEVKDNFLANISHEIRTPMNGVIGIIDVLKKNTDLTEKQKKYINIMSKSSNNMVSIINDLLDLSKLNAEELKVEYCINRIQSVIEEEIALFKELATENQNTIELTIDKQIPTYLKLGEGRVKQIIRNLLSNAIKFTENGKIIIKASLLETLETSYTIKIEVIDNGIGINIKDQYCIFDAFQQLDQSPTKKIKGTGLGLSICRELAELMNGEIGVKSELNKGSNFWFTFIAHKVKEKELNKIQKVEYIPENFTSPLQGKKILLVDDMEINILVAKMMLVSFECEVHTAYNGLEAIDKFNNNDFDLILMDIQMDKMDGIEAANHIRSTKKRIPPIIACSANAMEEHKQRYIAQGLDDYISKPFVIETLQKVLTKWLVKKIKSNKDIHSI